MRRKTLQIILLELRYVLNFKDDFAGGGAIGANGGFLDFNLCRIFKKCKGLRIFTVEFKDGMMVTPPVSYIGRLFDIIFIAGIFKPIYILMMNKN